VIAIEQYPLEKIQMDGARLQNLSADYAQDPFAESFVRGAAASIKQRLNEVDHDRATFFARQNALARFDPELAVAFLARAGGESVRARLELAEALIEAERRFLSAQALGIYEGTYFGDYGIKMRQMIEGEYRLLQDRRSAARKQNVTPPWPRWRWPARSTAPPPPAAPRWRWRVSAACWCWARSGP
jgi:hypothetical protein